ncbi:MAG: hypothetical protein N2203_01010 [Bacteroidia bacterium]|nr:hypothetical protein [Bacteroidia bacterium]
MKWIKKGRILEPQGQTPWMKKYGILPTPYYIEEKNIIRIFFGTSAEDNICKITYLDVNADNPSEVLYLHKEPLLAEGELGLFDEHGVNPSQLIFINEQPYLFYIGYQRLQSRASYMLFCSYAVLNNELNRVVYRKKTPILDRTDEEPFIRSAITIIKQQTIFHLWYVSAYRWEYMNNEVFKDKWMPNYHIKYAQTKEFKEFQIHSHPVIYPLNNDEFGFGRPWCIFENGTFKMWYSLRRRNTTYRIGYAESTDGTHWVRKDDEVGIDVSESGWDSEMICYPAVITVKNKTYMFYNGNNNGATGFGYAELMK